MTRNQMGIFLKQFLLLATLTACTLSAMGDTTVTVATDPANVDVADALVKPSFLIGSALGQGNYAAIKIKVPISGGTTADQLTLELYEQNSATTTDVTSLCATATLTDLQLCSFVAELPVGAGLTGDYYLLASRTIDWTNTNNRIDIFYVSIDVFSSLANLNSNTAVSSTIQFDIVRDEFVHIIHVTTAMTTSENFDISGFAVAGGLDFDLFDIVQTVLWEQLELATGTNLLTDAPTGGITVSAPAVGIPIGLYLLVLKRPGGETPSSTFFTLSIWTEQAAASQLSCPYDSSLTARKLITCAPLTNPLPTGFDTVIGTFTAEAYTYTNDFDFAPNPHNIATYNLGTLTSGNWVSVQLKLNNAQSTTDPGIGDLLINIYSSRADGANTDISTLCDGFANTATECVFTYQITASVPSTHYLVIGAVVDFSAVGSSILQTYQIEVNSFPTLADLNADTNPIATHDNTDVLRNDIVRLVFISQPIYYQVSLTGATGTSAIYMWATTEGAASPIDDYMTATGSQLLTSTSTGVYNAILLPGQYILAVSSGTIQVNNLVLNLVYSTPGKNCHFNSAWEDLSGVFADCVTATVAAPTITAVADITQVDHTFSTSFVSNTNPYYQIRYNLGSLSVGNYVLIKLLGFSSAPEVRSLAITLHRGLADTTGISLGHKCTATDSCTFSYTITQAADYYLLINEPFSFLNNAFTLETLHIQVDAFASLSAFNAGSPSLGGIFPLQKTDAHRKQVLRVIQITQPSSFQVELNNVPANASNAANKQTGWNLTLYSAGSSLGNRMTTSGSNLLTQEAYASTGGNLTYRAILPVGWYVLGAGTPTDTSQVSAIGMQYFNTPFDCHFDNTWSDDFATYSSCAQANPVPAAPTGFDNTTSLPSQRSFTFTTNLSNTDVAFTQPRFSLGLLQQDTYLSVEIANPSHTTGSTAISSISMSLINSAGQFINLNGPFCTSETSACSILFMITHTDTYMLLVVGQFVPVFSTVLEYFSLQVKNFASSTDASSIAISLVQQTIPSSAGSTLWKYISLLTGQSIQIGLTNVPDNGAGAPSPNNFNFFLYSVTPATSTNPASFSTTTNFADSSVATQVYDTVTDTLTLVTQELAAGDYVLAVQAISSDQQHTLSYQTESYTCPFSTTFYPQTTYSPFDGCTGTSSSVPSFQSLPSAPLASLQSSSLTTQASASLSPLKLDHPIIIPLGYILTSDVVTVYIGVPNWDVNAITMDQFTLQLHQGSASSSGVAPSATTCDSTNKQICNANWTVITTDNHFLSIAFSSSIYIESFLEHFQIYAVGNVDTDSGSVLAQYSGVYSQQHVKYFYLSQTTDFTASLETLSSGNFQDNIQQLQIYPLTLTNPSNIYTVGTQVSSTSLNSFSPGIIGIKDLAMGNYILRLKYVTDAASVTLKWITNAYTCPFDSRFPDYMEHFQGCTNAVNTNTPITLQSLPNSFSFDFTTTQSLANTLPFKHPIYSLGSITSGKTIGIRLALVNIDANAAPISNFTIKLIQTTPDGTETDLTSRCNTATSACSISQVITTTNNYYLAIYDANSADPFVKKYLQWFVVEVIDDITAASPNTLLKVSDVFRDRVIKYIWISPTQATSFTLSPVAGGNTTNRDLELFAMSGSNNVFQVGTAQTLASTSSGTVQQYTTPSLSGFYMTAVKFNDAVASATVVPKTHSYVCPYPSDYPDIHVNFPGCSANSAVTAPAFLSFTATPLTSTYTTDITAATVNLPFESPIYELGTLTNADRLILDIQVPDAGTNGALISQSSIKLIRGSRRGSSQQLSSLCRIVIYNCKITSTISISDSYFLGISDPSGNFVFSNVQYFTVHAQKNTSGTVSTIFKYVDVLRNKVVKYFYSDGSTAHTLTLNPIEANVNGANITADLGSRFLTLYQTGGAPTQANVFSNTGSSITWANQTFDNSSSTHTYVTPTLSQGFYVAISTFNDVKNVTLTHSTLGYTCPYDSSFTDVHLNFQGCTSNVAGVSGAPAVNIATQFRAKPCVETDAQGTCTRCVDNYDLIGTECVLNVTCPDGQYFRFGACINLPADANCATYDLFTGDCDTCPDNFELLGNKCVFVTATCTARQWVNSNNQCADVSDTCGNFSPTNGTCTSCVSDLYQLDSVAGTCTLVVVTCSTNQYVDGLNCVNIPSECATFDSTLKQCDTCIQGYIKNLQGTCQRIQCLDRQYPGPNGECKNVSHLCDQYNRTTGVCITCAFTGYVPTPTGCRQTYSTISSCRLREILGYGKCIGPEKNCQRYNLITLECDRCLPDFEKSYEGLCVQKVPCGARQWSVNGMCISYPNNCSAINEFGLCITCDTGFTGVQGQCISDITCQDGFFLNDNGVCIRANQGCGWYNPSTGACVTCAEPGTFPNQGVCCPLNQIYSQASDQCISIQAATTALNNAVGSPCAVRHPTLNECLRCNAGFIRDPIVLSVCRPRLQQ